MIELLRRQTRVDCMHELLCPALSAEEGLLPIDEQDLRERHLYRWVLFKGLFSKLQFTAPMSKGLPSPYQLFI